MNVLVTGGTGVLGSKFIRNAINRGHTVRIFSRKSEPAAADQKPEWAQGDLVTGEGVNEALRGMDAVLHAASNPGLKSNEVDLNGTGNLVTALQQAEVKHLLYPSIVGIDRVKYFYYQNKQQVESIIASSGISYTILRGTQFHELIDQVFSVLSKVPFILPVPKSFQLQTIAAEDMAAQLVDYLEEGPAGRAPDFAGPEILTAETMAKEWIEARKKNKKLVNLPVWGKVATGFREGKVTNPQRAVGNLSWKAWLDQQQ